MSSLRTIVLPIKPASMAKEGDWIRMKDPYTGECDPPKLSLLNLNDEEFTHDPTGGSGESISAMFETGGELPRELYFHWRNFVHSNNEIVGACVACGFEPGKDYQRFLDVGLRASQQLSDEMRLRSVTEYENLREKLEADVRAFSKKAEKRNRKIRLYDIRRSVRGFSDADKAIVSSAVRKLSRKDPPELGKWVPGMRRGIKAEVERVMKDGYKELMEYYPMVADSVKARFFSAVKHADVLGKKYNIADGSCDDMYAMVSSLGDSNSNAYLDLLSGLIERDDADGFLVWTSNAAYEYIKDFGKEKRDFYFEVLGRTLERGMREYNVWIATGSASLLERYGIEDARRMAYAQINSHADEHDVMAAIDRMRMGL